MSSDRRRKSTKTSAQSALEVVREYHQLTKHYPGRYARAPGYMDWDTQPDPFRRFDGAELFELEHVPTTSSPSYGAIFRPSTIAPESLSKHSLAQLMYDSLALSAWKVLGNNRWSLRVNPSSGNLHPTEGYVLMPPIDGVSKTAQLCHYAPYDHALEVRAVLAADEWKALTRNLPPGTLLIGLTSIHWRESWKYGERAYRYCQHDVGHAIGSIAIAAAALGWPTCIMAAPSDRELAVLLGVHRQSGIEAEHPDCLLAISTDGKSLDPQIVGHFQIDADVIARLQGTPPIGKPNLLSDDHHEWPIIDVGSEAATRHEPPPDAFWDSRRIDCELPPSEGEISARQIIRQRRSAVAMDARTGITKEIFYRMMLKVTPARRRIAFDTFPWRPRIHLGLFVHRVDGLDPGLYFLVRWPDETEALKAALHDEFEWVTPPDCPASLSLYRLQQGDVRRAAAAVACGQDIAGDGAFALGMIAEFDGPLAEYGPWFYRHLHWEAGALGQVLYLEAEAAGIRATGIGCFFDDLMHEILGLKDRRYQTIYHFTVGGAIDDPRLQTEPPYAHLSSR